MVHITGNKSDLFPMHVGHVGSPFSPVLFIIIMDTVWVQGGLVREQLDFISIFADVVLLAPSGQDLQRVLGRFAAECEVAEMRISTSKSETTILNWKKVVAPSVSEESPCLPKRSQDASQGRYSWHLPLGGDPEEDLGHAARMTMSLGWIGNA